MVTQISITAKQNPKKKPVEFSCKWQTQNEIDSGCKHLSKHDNDQAIKQECYDQNRQEYCEARSSKCKWLPPLGPFVLRTGEYINYKISYTSKINTRNPT